MSPTRTRTRLLAALVALVALLALPVPARAASVTLSDAGLRAAVTAQLDELGIAYETVSAPHGDAPVTSVTLSDADLAAVTTLDLSNAGIESLEGIEAFSGLTSLTAYGNALTATGVAAVARLPRLTYLDLSRNRLADVEGAPGMCVTARLSGLSELRHLDLSHCELRYTTGLSSLANLEHLDLFDNVVHDLTGLASWDALGTPTCALPRLTHLSLGENNEQAKAAWTGLDALSTLVNLSYLDFSCNQSPEVVGQLAGLERLGFLQLQQNGISDLRPLRNLTEMRTLVLSHNDVWSVYWLWGMTHLRELYLHGNRLYAVPDGVAEGDERAHPGLAGIFGEGATGELVWGELAKIDVSDNFSWGGMRRSAELARLFALDQAGALELGYTYDFLANDVAGGYDALAANGGDGTPGAGRSFGNTPLASLPHYDAERRVHYVTYDDFGARCDGVHDDFNAIANAHRFANGFAQGAGCEVRATAGKTYHIFRYYDASWYDARTSIDWRGATFVVHDEKIEDKRSRYVPLLCLRPSRNVVGSGGSVTSSAAYGDIVTMPTADGDETVVPSPDVAIGLSTRRLTGERFQAQLDALAAKGYERFYVTAEHEGRRQYLRYGHGYAGSDMWDGLIVDKDGVLLTKEDDAYYNRPQWDFEQVTKLTITPIPSEQAQVRNATFVVNRLEKPAEVPYARGGGKGSIYYYRHLQLRDCANVRVSNVSQKVGTARAAGDADLAAANVTGDGERLSGSYYGFLEVRDGAEITVEDCDFFAHKYRDGGRSTYGLIVNRCEDVAVNRVSCNGALKNDDETPVRDGDGAAGYAAMVDRNRWGVTGNNHVKDITYTDCVLNRIDAHEGYYNLKAVDCLLGIHAFRLTGTGPFLIERCRTMSEYVVSLRSDYGSTWDTRTYDAVGRIIDCTHEYHGQWSQNLIAVTGAFDGGDPTQPHDFGYVTRFPNVYVQNLTIDESCYDHTNDRETFTIVPNSKYAGNDTYRLPADYWPTNVIVNGVTLTGWEKTMTGRGGDQPAHPPYVKLVDTNGLIDASGNETTDAAANVNGIVTGDAERNFLVTGVTVTDVGEKVAGGERDLTERLMVGARGTRGVGGEAAGEAVTTVGPVRVSIDTSPIVSTSGGATIERSATLETGGRSIGIDASTTPWTHSFAEPGTYTITLASSDGVGGWRGERSLTFTIAGDKEGTARRLLYTRPETLAAQGAAGAAAHAGYLALTQDDIDGKDVVVRHTGATPRLRVYEEGVGGRGSRGTLYVAVVDATSTARDGDVAVATFSAADIAAAWADDDRVLAYDDAYEDGDPTKGVAVDGGAWNHMFVQAAAEGSTTLESVTLVGGTPVAHTGGLVSVTGRSADEILRGMGVGWNLGNALDAYVAFDVDGTTRTAPSLAVDWQLKDAPAALMADLETETWWSNPKTGYGTIKFVHDQGFNSVRVPVSWFQHVYDVGDADGDGTVSDLERFHVDDAWMARVREVVDYAYDQGMYVVLDTHHEKFWLERPDFDQPGAREGMKAELAALWTQIATEFAGYDQRLVFDGLNEPRAAGEGVDDAREWGSPTAGDVETLSQLHQTFVDTVRGLGGNNASRLLLCSTYDAGVGLHHISQLRVPTTDGGIDPMVAVSVHAYEPFDFARSYGTAWSDNTWSAANQVRLEQVLFGLYGSFVSRGVPVVIGEFAAQDFSNTAARQLWARAYLDLARGYGMACLLWDGGGTGTNDAGNRTAYVERTATPRAWANASQAGVVQAIVAAASDEGAAWRGRVVPDAGDVPGAEPPDGRQLNGGDVVIGAGRRSAGYSVRWSDVEPGDVAAAFAGTRAPTLVATDANGDGWTTVDPSYVAWNEGATGGVAYWWPSHLERLWLDASVDGVKNASTDNLRQLRLAATTGVTVTKLVLTGVTPASDVSGGGYGDYVTRLVYRRPTTLASPETPATPNRSIRIDMRAPAPTGEYLAVRYQGVTPTAWFTSKDWKASVSVRPYLDLVVPDKTDENVALFRWKDATDAWEKMHGDTASTLDYLDLRISGGTDAAPRTCEVVEVVELGGAAGGTRATEGTALVAGSVSMAAGAADDDRRTVLSPRSGDTVLWPQDARGVVWPAIEGKDIAVTYTGDVPFLWLCSDLWEGWQRLDPYFVEAAEDGASVAYVSAERVKSAWVHDRSSEKLGRAFVTDDLTRIYAVTDGATTILDARLLDVHDAAPAAGKAALSLAVAMDGWTYGEAVGTPVLEGNLGNGAVTYEYKDADAPDGAYTVATPSSAGSYTVRASVAETEGYQAGSVTATFTIEPRAVELAWGATSFGYDGGVHEVAPTLVGACEGDDVAAALAGTAKATHAGGYEVSATGLVGEAAGNYFLRAGSAGATRTWTITRAAITVAADDQSSAHGEPLNELSYRVGPGVAAGDVLSFALTTSAGPASPVGSYGIAVSWAGAPNPDYDATFVDGTYTITAAAGPDVAAAGWSGTYDGVPHGITVESSTPGAVVWYSDSAALTADNYDTAGSTKAPTRTGAGSTTVHYYVAAPNRTGVSGSRDVTVEPRVVELAWEGETFAYDGAPKTVAATVANRIGADDVTVVLDGATATHAAAAPYRAVAVALGGAAAANYALPAAAARAHGWSITQAKTNAATVRIAGWTYGSYDSAANAPVVTAAFGAQAATFAYADSTDGPWTSAVPAVAGTHFVRATIAETADYVGATSAPAAFEIAKAPAALGVSVAGWVEGSYEAGTNAPRLSGNAGGGEVALAYRPAGSGDGAWLPWSGMGDIPAGSYVVRADVAETANYLGGSVTASFEVTPSPGTATNVTRREAPQNWGRADLAVGAAELAAAVGVGDGGRAEVWIVATDDLADAERAAVERAASQATSGAYVIAHAFGARLFSRADGVVSELHELASAVVVGVDPPADLPAPGAGMVRSWVVVRLHDGVATLLPATSDAATGRLSFSTDRFSTFAIAYRDVPAATTPGDAVTPVGESAVSGGSAGVKGANNRVASGAAARLAKTGDPAQDATPIVLAAMLLLVAGIALHRVRRGSAA